MKRLMPPSLVSYLQTNPNCERGDLFMITLPTGTVFYATSGQLDITLLCGGLVNGNFEIADNAAPPSSWSLNASASLSYLTSGQHGGTQSLAVAATALYGGVCQTVSTPAAAGQLISVSGWFKTVSGASAGIIVHFLDSGGGIIDQFWTPTVTSSAWSLSAASKIAPAGTVALHIIPCLLSGTSGTFYCDDIVVGTPGWTGAQTTFKAATYGRWQRGAITSEASFSCSANTMTLACIAQQPVAYPGSTIGILNAAFHGLFDAALVTVYTVYMPTYGDTSKGLETKFSGTIKSLADINRISAEFECADAMYFLNQKVPARLFQSNCPWGFCDVNCNLSAPTYTTNFTAKSGSTQVTLTPVSAFTQAAGWATQGVVKCTAGANVGLSQTVVLHDGSGNLQMMNPWLLPITAGDTFSVIAGCPKTLSGCKARQTAAGSSVDNSLYFGGYPFIPPPTSAI